jgi:Asp-tRNA(Asn)/Glu-tRNA(Gln) amidotransferase A subunit family amidase
MHEITISNFHKLLRQDPSNGPALMTHYLEAIKQHDNTLKTLITINPEALKTAEQKATETESFNQNGTPYPALHSVPIILKDNYGTYDLPTSAGVLALKDLRTTNSEVVTRLLEAGAIILAKANLHEFALQGTTTSSLGGQTLNPYDASRTPGGSSGGTAAALACNFGLVGCGTDTMNSLRSPASACGIVGFRPSTGRVSCAGLVPVSETQDCAGPMGRTVCDVKVMYGIMKNNDHNGSTSISIPARRPGRQVRIGVLEAYFPIEGLCPGPELLSENKIVQDVIRTSLSSLTSQDMDITLVSIPDSSHPDWSIPTLLAKADTQAFEFQHYLDKFLESPYITSTPHRTLKSIIQSGDYDQKAVTHVLTATLEAPETYSPHTAAHQERLNFIASLKESLHKCFDAYDIDALAYPHQRQLPVKIGTTVQPGRNGVLAALTGQPAICLPGMLFLFLFLCFFVCILVCRLAWLIVPVYSSWKKP